MSKKEFYWFCCSRLQDVLKQSNDVNRYWNIPGHQWNKIDIYQCILIEFGINLYTHEIKEKPQTQVLTATTI